MFSPHMIVLLSRRLWYQIATVPVLLFFMKNGESYSIAKTTVARKNTIVLLPSMPLLYYMSSTLFSNDWLIVLLYVIHRIKSTRDPMIWEKYVSQLKSFSMCLLYNDATRNFYSFGNYRSSLIIVCLCIFISLKNIKFQKFPPPFCRYLHMLCNFRETKILYLAFTILANVLTYGSRVWLNTSQN